MLKTIKTKVDHYCPILLGEVKTNANDSIYTPIRILLDSGASASIVLKEFCNEKYLKEAVPTNWDTKGRKFTTKQKCNIQLRLPELSATKIIKYKMHVDTTSSKNNQYDMIIGRPLLIELGIDINISKLEIDWEGSTTPMKPLDFFCDNNSNHIWEEIMEGEAVESMSKRVLDIQEAQYQKANLKQTVKNCSNLNDLEQKELLRLLQKYEPLFDGTLGTWKTSPVKLELQERSKPYHAKPFPVPKSREKLFRKEVLRLEKLGVLHKINHSEWGAPTFLIPKKMKKSGFSLTSES